MSQFVYDFISTIFNLYLIVIFDSKLQFDVVNCLSYDCELFECPGHVNKCLYLVNIWPSPKNCHLNVKKLPKEHIFFKNCPKLSFFSKKCPGSRSHRSIYLITTVYFLAIFTTLGGSDWQQMRQVCNLWICFRYILAHRSRKVPVLCYLVAIWLPDEWKHSILCV